MAFTIRLFSLRNGQVVTFADHNTVTKRNRHRVVAITSTTHEVNQSPKHKTEEKSLVESR